MILTPSRFIVALLAAAFVLPCLVRAEKPAEPTTWHDFRDRLVEANRETLSGAYQAVGTHGDWDADAIAFLDKMAGYVADGGVSRLYKKNDVKLIELMLRGEALLKHGCTDPLVDYCYGVALDDNGKPLDAYKHFETAVSNLEAAGYSTEQIFAATTRLRRLATDRKLQTALDDQLQRLYLAVASGKLDDVRRRTFTNDLRTILGRQKRGDAAAFVEKLRAQPDTDPWVLSILDGSLQFWLAWDSRGSGGAGSVTDEGREKFREHLEKARACFTAAYEMAPQLPESATGMITVEMGDGTVRGTDIQSWFDRAVEAQLDFTPAYEAMFNAMLPRWGGGGNAEIYEVGLRGMKTGRYDTEAPWQLIRALEVIGGDTRRGWGILTEPTVYEALSFVAEQYAVRQDAGLPKDWHMTYRAALAWRAEKFSEARDILRKIGDRIDPAAFSRVGSQNPQSAIGHAIVMAGKQAGDVRSAEIAIKTEQYEAALKILKGIEVDEEDERLARPYLDARVGMLERQIKFQSGEWVDIQPPPLLDGWKFSQGRWFIENGKSLVGQSDQSTSVIMCEDAFGTTFELSGVLAPAAPRGGQPGIVIGRSTLPLFYILVTPGKLELIGVAGFRQEVPHKALEGLSGPQKFVLKCESAQVSFSLNGKEILTRQAIPAQILADMHVGLCTTGSSRFTKLRIRKLGIPSTKPIEVK